MTPPPVALGMFICEQVIVDQRTQNPSPISIFTGLAVTGFPSPPQRFSVFSSLTNGRGSAVIRLVVSRLDNGEECYQQSHTMDFPTPLMISNVLLRVQEIRFPVSGRYEFVLFVDSDPIAQRHAARLSALGG